MQANITRKNLDRMQSILIFLSVIYELYQLYFERFNKTRARTNKPVIKGKVIPNYPCSVKYMFSNTHTVIVKLAKLRVMEPVSHPDQASPLLVYVPINGERALNL